MSKENNTTIPINVAMIDQKSNSHKKNTNEAYLNANCKIKFRFSYINYVLSKEDNFHSIQEMPLRLIRVKYCTCWEDPSKNADSVERFIIKYKSNEIFSLSNSVKIKKKTQEEIYNIKKST